MEEPRNRYILLQDGRFGENLWSFDHYPTPKQLPKGALLEEIDQTEHEPGDSSRIAVKLIHRDSWMASLRRALVTFRTEMCFKCRREDVAPLTREEADLLLVIDSVTLRYQIYIDRGRLDFGKRLQGGSHVMVSVTGSSKNLPGVVRYKGCLADLPGTMFGVQLHVS